LNEHRSVVQTDLQRAQKCHHISGTILSASNAAEQKKLPETIISYKILLGRSSLLGRPPTFLGSSIMQTETYFEFTNKYRLSLPLAR
jgi:hypothetical protein